MAKILLVEEDTQLAKKLSDWLSSENHSVDVVNDGTEALRRLEDYKFDLVILSADLPQLSGIEVCKKYREAGGNSRIMMTSQKATSDRRITALDTGADDFMAKPFDMAEASAHVRALLRRPMPLTGDFVQVGDLMLETATFRVLKNGREINLVPKEFALLEFLMRHPNRVYSSEALISRVWPTDSEASPDTVRTHITRLRKKLDGDTESGMLKTIHGLGYKLEAGS